jgi:hypothetical protein
MGKTGLCGTGKESVQALIHLFNRNKKPRQVGAFVLYELRKIKLDPA